MSLLLALQGGGPVVTPLPHQINLSLSLIRPGGTVFALLLFLGLAHGCY
jgi:hypothetical protein